jgi:low affinity Fe/Cu permease
VLSVAVVVLWAITGPLFNYSDTWQLVINTATTVITFWLVFIIQYTQNRDNKALHLKLDALVEAEPKVSDELISIEKMTDEEIEEVYKRILRRRRAKR